MTVKEFNKLSIEKSRGGNLFVMPEYLFNQIKKENFDYKQLLGTWIVNELIKP